MSPMSITSISRSALVLGIGLGTLPGCPLLDVQADAQEVCLTYPNLVIPAAGGEHALTQSFVFDDLSSVHDLTKLDANLAFVRAEVRATSGITEFSFVEAAHLVVSSGDPASTLPPLTMYDCDGDCAPDGNRLEIPAAVAANAIDYLRSNSVKIDLTFQGTVPDTEWTMDVDVCMKARAHYTFSP
jgi:hypothetical protein